MKAAVFKKPGALLAIEQVADPEPGPNELVLKVKACGICGTIFTGRRELTRLLAGVTWRPGLSWVMSFPVRLSNLEKA